MSTTPKYDSLSDPGIQRRILDTFGYDPYDFQFSGISKCRLERESESYLNLASNDYLSLATDRRVKRAAEKATERYGMSTCGTPVATGSTLLLRELERRLANFCGLDSCLVFPSCWQANTALFSSLAGKQDAVLVDHYIHASLVHGIKTADCKIMPFRHNNCEHLEVLLRKCDRFRQVFVVTDSVFSTNGSICEFDKILALCRSYGAIPVVDDSHGIGVIGKQGHGVLEHFNIRDYGGIYTASLGKALVNSGGMLGGPAGVVEHLQYGCPGLIYSTALAPAATAGTLRVLDIIASDFQQLGPRLRENHTLLRRTLLECGFTVQGGEAPIISILCGSMTNTVDLARRFLDQRIVTTPFIEPSVPPNKGALRLIPQAGLSPDDIQAVSRAIRSIDGWPDKI